MARSGPASRNQLHVGRYFGALAALFAIMYSVVWFGGDDGPLTPKLGLDLRGGASVVLQVQQEQGDTPPTQAQLDTAIEIIQRRVNGLGVAEAEVVTQGSNIVVSVPGGTRESLRALTVTAQLRFREVLNQAAGSPQPIPTAVPTTVPTGSPAPTASAPAVNPAPSATSNGRAVPPALLGVAAPTPTPTATATSAASPAATPSGAASPTPTASGGPAYTGPKSGDVYTPQAFEALDCSVPGAREGGSLDKPEQQIIACSDDGAVKYQLDAAAVIGTDVKGATASLDQFGTGWQIVVSFTGEGQKKFTDLTVKTTGKNVAIVLDGLVLSAPTINERIDGDAQITGDFNRKSSAELANTLKYGALPLSFTTGQVEVVSATLGDDQLSAGLIAGGIGIAVVIVYAILYYRILGLVTIFGLGVAGSLVYGSVTILGDQIGFALSLAGIAGFIVAVGITADSFIVYFERLKDEVREGRSPRSAADRAWVRARRTILSANSVSFLSAITLYFLSVGSVRGFAFTLGLSTLIDVVVVFLFTRPLVSFLSRYPWFTNEKLSGLARPRGAVDPTPGKPGPTAPQEA
ncbi:MAG: protein translocase subunit SecD [Mycobacteriales bacterium]|nr:protein translocase subunit SecD [Mycobacteriales bacterium]